MPICPFSTSPCRMLSKWRAFPTRKFGWTAAQRRNDSIRHGELLSSWVPCVYRDPEIRVRMTPLHIYSGVHCAMCKYRSLWLGAYLLYGMTCGGCVSTPVFGKMFRVLLAHTCEIEGPSPLPLPLHLSIQHSDCYFHMNEHAFLAVSLNTEYFNANLFKIYKISLINIFIWSKHHESEVRMKNYSFRIDQDQISIHQSSKSIKGHSSHPN